eukprot:2607-Heterococcus_DN1.PRE.7
MTHRDAQLHRAVKVPTSASVFRAAISKRPSSHTAQLAAMTTSVAAATATAATSTVAASATTAAAVANSDSSTSSGEATQQLLLLPGYHCEPDKHSAELLLGAAHALPAAFVLERALLASALSDAASLPCTVTDTEIALRSSANDRLETLGDAWLKLNNLISNSRLTKCAIAAGLPRYIHPQSTASVEGFHVHDKCAYSSYSGLCTVYTYHNLAKQSQFVCVAYVHPVIRSMLEGPFTHHWTPPLLPLPPVQHKNCHTLHSIDTTALVLNHCLASAYSSGFAYWLHTVGTIAHTAVNARCRASTFL